MARLNHPYLPFFLWVSALQHDASLHGRQKAIESIPEERLQLLWSAGFEPEVKDVCEIIPDKFPESYFQVPRNQ